MLHKLQVASCKLHVASCKLHVASRQATLKDPRTQADPWGEATKYVVDIIGDLNAGAAGWIEWNVLLDSSGGPTCIGPDASSFCTPLVGHCDAPILAHLGTGGRVAVPHLSLIHISEPTRPY